MIRKFKLLESFDHIIESQKIFYKDKLLRKFYLRKNKIYESYSDTFTANINRED